MPRKPNFKRRDLVPDPKTGSTMVTRFVNTVMKAGKKSTAEAIVYGAFDIVQSKLNDDPLKLFKKALDNVKPVLEVKSRRVGGATYQVPVEIKPERRTALAFRWLIQYARSRPDKTMAQKLASEILAASRNEGGAIKKKEDTHRMAEANKAFAHYRF